MENTVTGSKADSSIYSLRMRDGGVHEAGVQIRHRVTQGLACVYSMMIVVITEWNDNHER